MWPMLIVASLMAEPSVSSSKPVARPVKGYLVAVGGGTTLNAVLDRTLELAGGKSAKVVVIPDANPEYGPGSVNQWRRMGPTSVGLVNSRQPRTAVKMINEADLIWMPGGLQGLFMNSIDGTGIVEAVQARYRDGAVIGGTSAGAAVMSKTMIGGQSNLDELKAGTAPFLRDGLSLWPEVIIDQHFLQKGRFNRLALAVLDYPELVGIGIDEETAAIVHGPEFEVMGNGNITVLDARKASREKLVKGEAAAVRNMKVHVLSAGMKFRFDE